MNKKEFIQLLKKVREGTATEEERKFVEAYYDLLEAVRGGDSRLNEEAKEQVQQKVLDEIWRKINQQPPELQKVWRNPAAWKAAASVALLLTAGAFFYTVGNRQADQVSGRPLAENTGQHHKDDIQPGSSRAVLALAGGQTILLDSAQQGVLARQGNTKVVKLADGQLAYQGRQSGQRLLYNTVTTPKGGQYTLTLSDGSKVWLNAASMLRFPTAFTGKERKVEMKGEVYFEIAKQIGKPFVVETGGARIEVLGTRFNVNTYDKNTVRTTLAEGQVKISQEDKSSVLTPGEEASITKGAAGIYVQKVNVDKTLAWKNGLFYFENTNIRTIMQEVSRWYNVEVVYQTRDSKNKNFSGVLSRYSQVNALLKRLELTGAVHFRIEGKKIVVTD